MTLPTHPPLRCFYAISFILFTIPALTYGACPTTATTFEFNAPPSSATTTDTSNLLTGKMSWSGTDLASSPTTWEALAT